MSRKRTPSYRHHKPSNQAFVELNGKRKYLGVYGTPASRQAYHRKVAEWEANGRTLPVKPEDLTVAELSVKYLRYSERHYRNPMILESGDDD